ncbi:MAG TPA: exo-alpha-sialidase, partial [Blastocatellia bacterium]|nr:exo-alpha-sialidase [Blastocatellia bacterium]
MKAISSFLIALVSVAGLIAGSIAGPAVDASIAEKPFHKSELIFPLEHWHNHASAVVECPNGDLLVCWFHGSGERTADDVKVEGARLRKGSSVWEPRFAMADTPGYPDTNCTIFIDPRGRLWLMWPTIIANQWETALMKYRISSDYQKSGPPKWEVNEVLHVTPGADFEPEVARALADFEVMIKDRPELEQNAARGYIERTRKNAADKYFRRMGWMTRAHPFVLDGKRLIVPLYSDGFSFSIMAITDDWGQTWTTSNPLVGGGNIQPSIVQKKDGSLYTLMRDNGPAPKRLHASTSTDRGRTWSKVVDSSIPNPGSGAEVISLRNGNWALIFNDTERGRHSLAVAISDDEGATWKWKRHLELDQPGPEA